MKNIVEIYTFSIITTNIFNIKSKIGYGFFEILIIVGVILTISSLILSTSRIIPSIIMKAIIFIDSFILSIFLINTILGAIASGGLTDNTIALYNIKRTSDDRKIIDSIIVKEKQLSMLKDSIKLKTEELAYQRNQFLINSILQHQAIIANFEKAEKDSRNEIRIYYFTILSALLAFIFIKKKQIILGFIGLIIVIYYMYSLDMHHRDLEQRQHKSAVIVSYSMQKLTNINPSSKISYKIDFDTVSTYMKKEYETDVEKRKWLMLSQPDVVQDTLYGHPFRFVLSLLIYNFFIWLMKKIKLKNEHSFEYI